MLIGRVPSADFEEDPEFYLNLARNISQRDELFVSRGLSADVGTAGIIIIIINALQNTMVRKTE